LCLEKATSSMLMKSGNECYTYINDFCSCILDICYFTGQFPYLQCGEVCFSAGISSPLQGSLEGSLQHKTGDPCCPLSGTPSQCIPLEIIHLNSNLAWTAVPMKKLKIERKTKPETNSQPLIKVNLHPQTYQREEYIYDHHEHKYWVCQK